MTEATEGGKIGRRKVLAGLAAAGGIAAGAAVAGIGIKELAKDDKKEPPVGAPDLRSVFIGEPVPALDPDSGLWNKAEAQTITVQGQNVIPPLKTEAAVLEVRARSLHDGETIAFLLEWEDQEANEHTIKTDQFRDACGVFLGPGGAPPSLWTMGMADNPVTIVHWKADWQKDVDAGFQDLEVAFPNAWFDFYPPLVGAQHPIKPQDYPEEARNRLPGWHVGNPISEPEKKSPVEKLRAIGPGTLEHLATQNVSGRGVWNDGKWKVALAKPMRAADPEEITIEAGKSFALAFSVWSGSETDRGSRKAITTLGTLTVDAA